MEKLYTVKETAAQLRIKPDTLYGWTKNGQGPSYVRMGTRKIMFRETAIKEYLDRQEVVQ